MLEFLILLLYLISKGYPNLKMFFIRISWYWWALCRLRLIVWHLQLRKSWGLHFYYFGLWLRFFYKRFAIPNDLYSLFLRFTLTFWLIHSESIHSVPQLMYTRRIWKAFAIIIWRRPMWSLLGLLIWGRINCPHLIKIVPLLQQRFTLDHRSDIGSWIWWRA